MTPDVLETLVRLRDARRLAVLATRLPDGLQLLLSERDGGLAPVPGSERTAAGPVLAAVADLARAAVAGRGSHVAALDGADWFLHVHVPPPRLLVVGAVHIAQVLAPMARSIGYAVSVIDPRDGFATAARFPDTDLVPLWPDDGLRSLGIDRHTAVVVLTHDPKLDDPALDVALRSPAPYVGALGSRRTQGARRARLRDAGLDDDAIGRLRGPVGLPIGAIGAPEIALSILAEMVAVRRGGRLAERPEGPAGP